MKYIGQGEVVNTCNSGANAQIVIKSGAYAGTYHCTFEGTSTFEGTIDSIHRWFTCPNKKTGEQMLICTPKESL